MHNIWHSLKKFLDEGGVEEIFSHFRNLLIATVVLASGTYVIRQPSEVDLFGVSKPENCGPWSGGNRS